MMYKKPLSLTKLVSPLNKKMKPEELKLTNKNTPKSRLMMNSPKRALGAYQDNFFKKSDEQKSKKRDKKIKGSDNTFSMNKKEDKTKIQLSLNKGKLQQLNNQKLKLGSHSKSSVRLLSKGDQYKQLETKLTRLQNRIINAKNSLERSQPRKSKHLQQFQTTPQQHPKTISIHPKPQSKVDLSNFVTQVHNKHSHNDTTQDPYFQTEGWYYISLMNKSLVSRHLQLVKQHINQCLYTMKFMSKTKKPSDKQILQRKQFLHQKQCHKNKLTVILDLDQTLIHCNQSPSIKGDVLLPIKFNTGQGITASINIRPYCIQFLKVLSKTCQIIIFTASHQTYANVVLNYLDPKNEYISHRLYRQNCFQTPQGIYVKDLRIINRDMNHMLLVDNAAYSYFFQLKNGIPIVPYYKGKNDYELQYLQQYIYHLQKQQNPVQYNSKYFLLESYFQFKDAKSLVKKLYPQNSNKTN